MTVWECHCWSLSHNQSVAHEPRSFTNEHLQFTCRFFSPHFLLNYLMALAHIYTAFLLTYPIRQLFLKRRTARAHSHTASCGHPLLFSQKPTLLTRCGTQNMSQVPTLGISSLDTCGSQVCKCSDWRKLQGKGRSKSRIVLTHAKFKRKIRVGVRVGACWPMPSLRER